MVCSFFYTIVSYAYYVYDVINNLRIAWHNPCKMTTLSLSIKINLLKPTGYVMHQPVLTFNNCTLFPHCINVFCIYLRKNCDLCYLQHKLIGFWIKRDQLDVTCFFISLFNAQHVSDFNTSILSSLRLICWVISWVVLLWFDVCWCYVVVWLGWCGISMQAGALVPRVLIQALVPQPSSGYHNTPAKPQRNTNTHRTRAIQPMK